MAKNNTRYVCHNLIIDNETIDPNTRTVYKQQNQNKKTKQQNI